MSPSEFEFGDSYSCWGVASLGMGLRSGWLFLATGLALLVSLPQRAAAQRLVRPPHQLLSAVILMAVMNVEAYI